MPEWIKEPAPPEVPYTQQKALSDLPGIAYALHLFLASHMLEAEEYCNKSDPPKYVVVFVTVEVHTLMQCTGNGSISPQASASSNA